jgi:hypothetical protein
MDLMEIFLLDFPGKPVRATLRRPEDLHRRLGRCLQPLEDAPTRAA